MNAEKEMQSYLRITAPFDGVVTERLVHPGALVGPGTDPVLLTIQQISRLRLVVAVPEEYVGGIVEGAKMTFQVPRFSRAHIFGNNGASFPCARQGNPDHGGRVGRRESRRFACAGNVSERQVAHPAIPPRAVRSENQRRDHHRADLCRARTRTAARNGWMFERARRRAT